MTVKTETQHQGEFLLSEANGELSREVGTLTAGENVVDGQVLKNVGGKLVAAVGTLDSSNNNSEDIAGIAYGACNASSTGPKGSVDRPITFISRLAEVKLANLTLYTGSVTTPKTTAMKADLLARYIQVR